MGFLERFTKRSLAHASENLEGRETPKVFYFEGRKDKPIVAIALKDPGGTNFLLPAIRILQKAGYPMYLYTTGHTRDAVPMPEGFSEIEPVSLSLLKPSIVVRTCADRKKGASRSLDPKLEEVWSGATFIDIEDYPGSSQTIGGRDPNYLCVINDHTKKTQATWRSGMNPENIIVTGSPVFDEYAGADHGKRRFLGREKLGVVDDEFVVLFSGQNPPATPIALTQTVASLNALTTNKKLVLLFSRHPRDKTTDYSNILGAFHGRVEYQTERGLSTEEAGYTADLLVSTHSTEALKSMHRGVPTLHIALSKELRETDDYRQFEQPPFPVQADASFWVDDGNDTAAAAKEFKKAIDDDKERQNIQERARNAIKINKEDPDGKSAQRVADAIMHIASR